MYQEKMAELKEEMTLIADGMYSQQVPKFLKEFFLAMVRYFF
jgi:hypothetical protein